MVNPERDLPITMIASVSTITLLYLIMNVAYAGVLTSNEILRSDTVAQVINYLNSRRIYIDIK